MKLITAGIVALALMASAGAATAGSMDASIRNCAWCHGNAAQGVAVSPSLAGQRRQYIENQLASLRAHSRDNPFSKQYMWGAAANLGPRTTRDLAVYFSMLPPRAAEDGHREFVDKGRAVYQDGIPNANIVACAVCHGPKGEGARQIPRLGGLSYSYLKRKLRQWREGYHASAAAPMPRIAATLPPNVVEEVASYLSFVK